MPATAAGGATAREVRRAAWLFIALTILLSYPLSFHPAANVLSAGTDTDLFVWTLGWDVHAFTHAPFAIFDANIFFPLHNTLAYSENLIGSAVVAAPIIWVTANPVLAMNLVALAASAACALGAYVLARRLRLSDASAIVCGLIFGFSPPRFLRLDQLHLATIEWVPFTLAYLHSYFDTGRKRDLKIAAGFLSLQAVTSGHGAAFLVLAMALFVAYRRWRGEPLALLTRVRDLGWTGVLLLVPAALIYWPYYRAQVEVGLRRPLEDWTITASSFINSGAHAQAWLLSLLPDWTWIREPPDAWLFPGILPLLLAMAAFVAGRRAAEPIEVPEPRLGWRRAALSIEVATSAALAVAIWTVGRGRVALAVGQTVLLTARPWHAWTAVALGLAARALIAPSVPLAIGARAARAGRVLWPRRPASARDHRPLYFLVLAVCLWLAIGPPWGLWRWVYWLPGLSFVRVPARFMLLGILAVAVLAATGFERLTSRVSRRQRIGAAWVTGVLLVAESAAMPFGIVPYAVTPPAIDRWLDQVPKPFAIVEVPLPDSSGLVTRERRNSLFMLHSMAHWQPTVEGYSGLQPPGYQTLYWQITRFPDPESLARLTDLGVTYVVVHADLYAPSERAEVEGRFDRYANWLTLEHADGDGRVYALHRPK